jgi:hypothetical protein
MISVLPGRRFVCDKKKPFAPFENALNGQHDFFHYIG